MGEGGKLHKGWGTCFFPKKRLIGVVSRGSVSLSLSLCADVCVCVYVCVRARARDGISDK